MQKAERIRRIGNHYFERQDYETALTSYSNSLHFFCTHQAFGNRAQTFLQLGKFREALLDAKRAIRLARTWNKGWIRKGAALMALGHPLRAQRAFAQAFKLSPDKATEQKLQEATAAAKAKHRRHQHHDVNDKDEDDMPALVSDDEDEDDNSDLSYDSDESVSSVDDFTVPMIDARLPDSDSDEGGVYPAPPSDSDTDEDLPALVPDVPHVHRHVLSSSYAYSTMVVYVVLMALVTVTMMMKTMRMKMTMTIQNMMMKMKNTILMKWMNIMNALTCKNEVHTC